MLRATRDTINRVSLDAFEQGLALVGLLALTSGVAGIVSGLFGEAATKTAGATSAMAAVWANVVFLLGFVAILLIRTS